MINSRSTAALILQQVFSGQSLSQAMQTLQHPDRALIQEMCFGVMRFLPRLHLQLNRLMKKPLKEKDNDIYALLVLGLYQLEYLRIPDHAAVSETVSAVKVLNKSWAKGLVNGVLRNYQRQAAEINAELADLEEYQFAHPQWLLDCFKHDWPQHWRELAQANNKQAPLHLRVCEQHLSRDRYLQELATQGLQGEKLAYSQQGVVIQDSPAIESLPGYQEGWIYIQDEAAQLAAGLMQVEPQMRVLDACGAPGGKGLHILDLQPNLQQLDILDSSANRLQRTRDNCRRYGLNQDKLRLLHADVLNTQDWWGKEAYHRILLDAPCSGTGVIRRKPDIKYHRKAHQLEKTTQLQRELLQALWPLLHRGGYLLYCTCSVLKRENNNQMNWLLSEFKDATIRPLPLPMSMPQEAGHQILTKDKGMDGFYYACLEKH